MSRFRFVTRWELAAPFAAVWEEIAHPLDWPGWWRGVERVEELEPGDETGVGSFRRNAWKSRLPYRLTFELRTTRVESPRLLEGRAEGELDGVGRWTFEEGGGVTRVRYDWEVTTHKRWMNLLAPLARPLFEWNHDVVTGWGLEGREGGCPSPISRRLGRPPRPSGAPAGRAVGAARRPGR